MTTANAAGPVILLARDFRLPEVLRHIEAGRIVLVVPASTIPPPQDPATGEKP